jgi:hypothetical protein
MVLPSSAFHRAADRRLRVTYGQHNTGALLQEWSMALNANGNDKHSRHTLSNGVFTTAVVHTPSSTHTSTNRCRSDRTSTPKILTSAVFTTATATATGTAASDVLSPNQRVNNVGVDDYATEDVNYHMGLRQQIIDTCLVRHSLAKLL